MSDLIQVPENDTARQSLTILSNAARTFLNNAKQISVPQDFVALHLNYLNTSIKEGDGVKKILTIRENPVLAVIGVREVIQSELQFQNIILQYQQIRKHKGITFTSQ